MANHIKTFYLFNPTRLTKTEVTYKDLAELTGWGRHTLGAVKHRRELIGKLGSYVVDVDIPISELRELVSKTTIEDETWKKVKGFTDYKISTYGRIKSASKGKEVFLIPYINRAGYLSIRLKKDGKVYTFSVHRLVAETFLYKPTHKSYLTRTLDDLDCVGHKDGDIFNNEVPNLLWISKHDLHRIKKKKTIPVVRIDHVTNKKEFYDSLKDASEESFVTPEAIGNCLKGLSATSGGYMWRVQSHTERSLAT